jgi:hypothetical protein
MVCVHREARLDIFTGSILDKWNKISACYPRARKRQMRRSRLLFTCSCGYGVKTLKAKRRPMFCP